MSCEPGQDLRMLVGGVVVRNQMQVEIVGRLTVNLLEKAQPLHVCVAHLRERNELAGERDQRGKQRDGAVARIIVRHGYAVDWVRRAEQTACAPTPGIGSFRRSKARGHWSTDRDRARSRPKIWPRNWD